VILTLRPEVNDRKRAARDPFRAASAEGPRGLRRFIAQIFKGRRAA
jgi:hypothetical protein